MSKSYQIVPGLFIQDDPSAVPSEIGAVPPRFGLKDSSDTRWHDFLDNLNRLNDEADSKTSYKLIIFSRHGQGFHNVGEAKYGTEAWDEYWSKLNGDGEIVWGPDPKLTVLGEDQARAVNTEWRKELSFGIPVPSKRFCSPMTRAIQTYLLAFENVLPETSKPAIIVEKCREEYGEHTCDKRNSRTWISSTFPQFAIEKGFTEEDELWAEDEREPKAHVVARATSVLDMIFGDKEICNIISVTAHGGIINGFLVSMGRRPYALPTGGVLPVLVKSIVPELN